MKREESGFGFRIIGGTEEASQVAIGYVVPGGVADVSGLLRTNDEITTVDGIDVLGEDAEFIPRVEEKEREGESASARERERARA